MKKYLFLTFLILFGCSNSSDSNPPVQPSTNSHVEFGTPTDDSPNDDYLITRPQYIISYNKNKGVPNWVSYNLEVKWFGDVPRYDGNFITDNSLPEGYYRVVHADYTNSGYDRGHMVRSEERTATDEDNKSTFILSNIIPQTPDLNRGVWLDFEYYAESLCKDENKELYIITGGIYHSTKTLKDEGKVAIPDSCFKIIVVMDKDKGLPDITSQTTVIAVIMPNIDGIRSDKWSKYVTTVDNIEFSTGYNFLDKVPDAVENAVEAKG